MNESLAERLKAEFHREKTAEEIAEQQAMFDRLMAFFRGVLPAVLVYCEVVIVASVLFAAWRLKLAPLDHVLVGVMVAAVAVGAWCKFQGMWKQPAIARRTVDAFTWPSLWKALGSTALALILMGVGYRMSLVLERAQFGSSVPAVASTARKATPASARALQVSPPSAHLGNAVSVVRTTYTPVSFPELFTAPWVQVWGSILAAALGAGLAVGGAVLFERRHQAEQRRNYAAMLVAVIQRIAGSTEKLVALLEDSKGIELPEMLGGMHVFDTYTKTLDQFAPFVELGEFGKVQAVLEVSLYLAVVRASRDQLARKLRPGVLYNGKNSMPGLLANASHLLEVAQEATGRLLER